MCELNDNISSSGAYHIYTFFISFAIRRKSYKWFVRGPSRISVISGVVCKLLRVFSAINFYYIDIKIAVVSSGFRGLPSIMFGIITNDDQVKDDQATQVVGKGPNFIGFGAKLAEEAFQQVG
jgi:hypothetical protein